MKTPVGVKRPRRESDNSRLCHTEVENAWRYTPSLPYVFMTQYWNAGEGAFWLEKYYTMAGFCVYGNEPLGSI
jgi:hypothetical protein